MPNTLDKLVLLLSSFALAAALRGEPTYENIRYLAQNPSASSKTRQSDSLSVSFAKKTAKMNMLAMPMETKNLDEIVSRVNMDFNLTNTENCDEKFPSVSANGKWLAFYGCTEPEVNGKKSHGEANIFLENLEERTLTRIYSEHFFYGSSVILHPYLSKDGGVLSFIFNGERGKSIGVYDIKTKQFREYQSLNPTDYLRMSEDGRKILFRTSSGGGLKMIDTLTRIVTEISFDKQIGDYCISQDGKKIAVSVSYSAENSDVWVIDMDKRGKSNVAEKITGNSLKNNYPVFLDNGKIFYATWDEESGSGYFNIVDLDSGQSTMHPDINLPLGNNTSYPWIYALGGIAAVERVIGNKREILIYDLGTGGFYSLPLANDLMANSSGNFISEEAHPVLTQNGRVIFSSAPNPAIGDIFIKGLRFP